MNPHAATNINMALSAIGAGGPTGHKIKSDDPLLRPKTAKALADAEREWGEAFEALDGAVGNGGMPAKADTPARLERATTAWHALRAAQGKAVDEVAEDRPKLITDAEAALADAETTARTVAADLDVARDKIAEARDKLSRAKDDSAKQRSRKPDPATHRPGGGRSTAAIFGLEEGPMFVYVTPGEYRKLQRGQAATDVNGEAVAELHSLVRVRHNVPLSAQRGDAPGGPWA
jgi:hypothetical protein